jgi:hypothetical protein
MRVGLPGLEPGTSSLSETKAYVLDVHRCFKMPANPYFLILQAFCMFTAVQVRCRQIVVSRRLPRPGQAIQQLSGPYLALMYKQLGVLGRTRTCDLLCS